MRSASKFVGKLSDEQQADLEQIYRSGKTHRERQRAHAVLLSAAGHSLEQLATIFGTDRDTVSNWLDRFAQSETQGLVDAPKSGRPTTLNETVREHLEAMLSNPSPNLKQLVLDDLKKKTSS